MYQQIQAEVEPGRRLVQALCVTVGVSWAGYYRQPPRESRNALARIRPLLRVVEDDAHREPLA
jgi:hypothetical protein